MAENQVTIKIPYDSITTISAEHDIRWMYGKKCGQLSLGSNEGVESRTAESRLNIPLSGLPKTAIVKSVKIPITNEIVDDTAGVAGSAYAVFVENIEYGVDANGNITDSNLITHLNNYKNQHGVFPDITFYATSWVYKPTETTAHVYFILDYPIIVCAVEGGQATYRPNADISVGHEIPSGFTGVYQLINEVTSDGDATCLSSHGGNDGSSATYENKTSVVTIGSPFPEKTDIIQIRILASLYLNTTNPLYASDADVRLTLLIDGSTSTTITQGYTVLQMGSSDAWVNKSYYLFEGIIDPSFINAINNYYKENGSMPRVDIQINTEARGDYEAGSDGGKGHSGDTDARVSQVYLEVVYQDKLGFNIHRKVNGTWLQVQAAFKKQNGAWVELTEDECKQELNNAPILTRGEVT